MTTDPLAAARASLAQAERQLADLEAMPGITDATLETAWETADIYRRLVRVLEWEDDAKRQRAITTPA